VVEMFDVCSRFNVEWNTGYSYMANTPLKSENATNYKEEKEAN